MTERLQVILAVLMIVVFLNVVAQVKKNRLALKYALPWMGMILCLLITDIFPEILTVVSGWMGIELPINMLMLLGFFFVLVLCFFLTVHMSRQTNEIRQLTQEVALLREELEKRMEG